MNPADSAPVETPAPPAEAVATVAPVAPLVETIAAPSVPTGPFRTLYESFSGTLTAVAIGVVIIVGIQFVVSRIFNGARSMSDSLTTFATSMVAVLVGIYVCDLLIAGPDTSLLNASERTTIVTFIKDISLMCFSYYFGSKTGSAPGDNR